MGSTDVHTSLAAIEEGDFFGKVANAELSPKRITPPVFLDRQGRAQRLRTDGLGPYRGLGFGKHPPGPGAPTFKVYALRDPIGANLDRIQTMKVWVEGDGNTHEKVYDVAWPGDRTPDAEGNLPSVGNTVDIAAANWTNTIGALSWEPSGAILISTPPRARFTTRALEIHTPAMGGLRRLPLRYRNTRGGGNHRPGARLHEPDLVQTKRVSTPFSQS